MSRREELARMTVKELRSIASSLGVVGRSSMNKADLIAAIDESESPVPSTDSHPSLVLPGISSRDRATARTRREELYRRLAVHVEPGSHCDWQSIEGHPCGLPLVVGTHACGLHGDGSIMDTAIPLTGSLGFGTWPTLWRHLTLATYDIDSFGLDPVVAEMAWHLLNGLYYDYFRVEVEGIDNVPMSGGAVLVANHGGAALPYDAAMLALAVLNEAPRPRRVRVIATEIFNMLPTVSHLYRKVGAAYASRDDARELLARGHLLGVFPEGEHGFMKPVWEAYRVGRLGRGGFAEIAAQARVPIVPVAIVGSEEVHPAVMVSKRLARLVRVFFPDQRVEEIAVALNPVPLPIRWKLRFLPPVQPEAALRDPDALDHLEQAADVRQLIQHAIDDILANRRTAF